MRFRFPPGLCAHPPRSARESFSPLWDKALTASLRTYLRPSHPHGANATRYAVGMLLNGARGTLTPTAAHLPHLSAELEECARSFSEFHRPASHLFPAQCIDGRTTASHETFFPHIAGGTLSLWVSTLLCEEDPDFSIRSLERLCAALRAQDLPCGGHDDTHASGAHSGCGAADHLPALLRLVAEAPPEMLSLVRSWGFDSALIDEDVRRRAGKLAQNCPSGRSLVDTLRPYASGGLPCLEGDHGEVAILVNSVDGTVIDREAVAQRVGTSLAGEVSSPKTEHVQFFTVDTWALSRASEILGKAGLVPALRGAEEQQRVRAVFAALNVAALFTLCAPTMPVITFGAHA